MWLLAATLCLWMSLCGLFCGCHGLWHERLYCTGNGKSDKFLLPENYSKADSASRPQRVQVNFAIHEVIGVDDINNEIEMQGYLTLAWNDSRIEITGEPDDLGEVHLREECRNIIWTPDVWIQGLVHFRRQEVIGDLAKLKIKSNNEIEYWQSVTLQLSCPMNLDNYPLDQQVCIVRFSSNGLRISSQVFEGQISLSEEANLHRGALQYNLTLEAIHDNVYHTSNCPTADPCWPQVLAKIRLVRYFKNHALQVFIPTGCLVILSWISFLIPPYIVPGRMVLLVTLLLVLFGSFASDHDETPKSSGVKVQDIWFISCIIFVLSAIFEYAICLFLKRNATRRKRKALIKKNSHLALKAGSGPGRLFSSRPSLVKRDDRVSPGVDGDVKGVTNEQILDILMNHVVNRPHRDRGLDQANAHGDVYDSNMEGEATLENIDYFSLKLFPAAFLLYMILFWATCLAEDDKTSNPD